MTQEQRMLLHAYNIERQIIEMFLFLVDQGIISEEECWELRHSRTNETRGIVNKIRAGLFSSTNEVQDRVDPWSGREEALEDEFMCGLHEIMNESEALFIKFGFLAKLRWLLSDINDY